MDKKRLFDNIKKASAEYIYLDAWLIIEKNEIYEFKIKDIDWTIMHLGYDVDEKQLKDDIISLENVNVDSEGCYVASMLFKICKDYDLISEGLIQDWMWYELEHAEYSYECTLEENNASNIYNDKFLDI